MLFCSVKMCITQKVRIIKCTFCEYNTKLLYLRNFSTDRKMTCLRLIPTNYRTQLSRMFSDKVTDLLSKNESLVCNYLNNLMKDSEKHTDYISKVNTLWNTRNTQDVAKLLAVRSNLCDNLKLLEELKSDDSKDKELESLVQLEKDGYKNQIKELDNDIVMLLVPEEPHDTFDDLVLEIKNGVGGQEAMLFAKDLFEMYCNYISYKGWNYEIAETTVTEIGGLRSSTMLVYGSGAFKSLCYEGGVHRVQRVPTTDRSGRVHTSTVTVAVLPQPSEIQVAIADKDLKIETKRASGAGGQHVNTTDSAVRILHLPTGIIVECQQQRSQIKNKQVAMQRLRAKLYENQFNEQLSKMKSNRKLQVGTSARSDKIRTYNFNQDRITDHRIGLSLFNIETFLGGGELLDKMVKILQEESELEKISEVLSRLKVN